MKRLRYTTAITLWQNWLLEKIPGSRYWKVQKEFVWYIDYEQKGTKYIKYSSDIRVLNRIIVNKWFKTDFGSIPQFLWIFFDKTKYISYILHDYLISKTNIERIVCDQVLIDAMALEWAWRIERFFIYIWVRIWSFFGIGRYNIDYY